VDYQTVIELTIKYGTPAVGAIVLFFVAWIAARIAGALVRSSLRRAHLEETLTRFFSKLVRWLVLVAGGVGILGMFGVETTSFAAIIGAAGLAVGLAFQGTLSNFASGIMLLVFRPFKVDDVVTVAGMTGKVYEIDLFTSTLDTPENRRIIIPNSSIFGSTIENITHHAKRRADVNVGVDYKADIDTTREALEKAAAGVEGVLEDPAPGVVLLELGASSVDWSVRVWCNSGDFGSVKQATIRAVKLALDGAGIGIPFPQMDVHVDQVS
jgi:small conductance mechanosensitive channel